MTTTIRGPEPLVDAIIAKLRSGLDERITQINAEAIDNIVITTPQASDYYTAPIDQLPRAPAIIATCGPAQWAGEGTHSFEVTYDVVVYVLEEDADRQVLGRRLQRQVRAITETVWDDAPREQLNAVSDGSLLAFRVRPRTTVPGRTFEPDSGDSWRAFYLVIFQASMFEGD